MMASLRLRRLHMGTDRFTTRLPGRELASLQRTAGAWQYEWSLRDDDSVWLRVVASAAVDGTWRRLPVHWRLTAVLTPAQCRWFDQDGADRKMLLAEVLRAQGHDV